MKVASQSVPAITIGTNAISHTVGPLIRGKSCLLFRMIAVAISTIVKKATM